jgi:hypothetical protein
MTQVPSDVHACYKLGLQKCLFNIMYMSLEEGMNMFCCSVSAICMSKQLLLRLQQVDRLS